MVKEKNILIAIPIFLLLITTSWGATVCTSYEGKKLCGNSLVVDCSENILTCKRLAYTNSHLTSGSKVEICDNDWKCTEIKPSKVLNDVVNDVAVFEIPHATSILANVTISGSKISSVDPVIYPDPDQLTIGKPSWVEGNIAYLKKREIWQSEHSGFGTFVVAPGMSGSPVIKPKVGNNLYDVDNSVLGLVTGHHNFIPVSSFVKESDVRALGHSYLQGERGLDKKSKALQAKWHYSPEGKTTYRSIGDGKLWETGLLQTPSGGGTGTDTGGGTGTDTGGGTGTDTGGGSGTDTGGGSGTDTGGGSGTDTGLTCGPEIPLNTKLFTSFNKHFSLYHGVIINDKKVIGFLDKKSGRIIHANWELISHDDIASGKYEHFEPVFEDKFSAKDLIDRNKPELFKGVKYCLPKSVDCAELTFDKDEKLTIVSGKTKTVINLKDKSSSALFKNIPIQYPSGKKSTIWLADIFLPDARLDSIRDSQRTIIGGNHKTGSLDVLLRKD